ncbi:MAG TPA: IS256 family transposase, partial [Caulobacteraceae bacterium]|nr:IS256 family transposase [Caulobacteraceae bacterium]
MTYRPVQNPGATSEPGRGRLREMIGYAAEKLMELEIGAKTGAALGEK